MTRAVTRARAGAKRRPLHPGCDPGEVRVGRVAPSRESRLRDSRHVSITMDFVSRDCLACAGLTSLRSLWSLGPVSVTHRDQLRLPPQA